MTTEKTHLIVGLGNPGAKYLMTRHNIGFMAIDALAELWQVSHFKTDHKALVAKHQWEGHTVILVKPQTFMNLSGEPVHSLLQFYKLNPDQLLVIHDEVDQPFGVLRYHFSRGHAGHNGVRNVHLCLGTPDYGRLRLGISRPSHPAHEVSDYVLQNFSKEEITQLPEFLSITCESIEFYLKEGLDKTANRYNQAPARK